MKQNAPNQRLILLEVSHVQFLPCRIFRAWEIICCLLFCFVRFCMPEHDVITLSAPPGPGTQPPSNLATNRSTPRCTTPIPASTVATESPLSPLRRHQAHPSHGTHPTHWYFPTHLAHPAYRAHQDTGNPTHPSTHSTQPASLNAAATRRPGHPAQSAHGPGSRCPSPPCPPDGPSSTGSPCSPSSPVSPSHPATWRRGVLREASRRHNNHTTHKKTQNNTKNTKKHTH